MQSILLSEATDSQNKEYTIGEWMDIWFDVYAEVNLRKSTIKIYKDARRRFLSEYPNIESLHLSNLTIFDFQSKINQLCSKYAKSTIRHIRILYNKIYAEAVSHHYCLENPISKSTLPKNASEKTIESLTQDELKNLEIALQELNTVDRSIIRFFLYTGLRMSELINLKWNDWVHHKNYIRVRDSKTKAGIRLVPLIPESTAILQNLYRRTDKIQYIFSNNSQQVKPSHLRHICNKAAKLANISHLTPHMLRHTFATRLIEYGADPKSVSMIIGHKNVAFTLQCYVSIDPKHLASEIQVLSKICRFRSQHLKYTTCNKNSNMLQ